MRLLHHLTLTMAVSALALTTACGGGSSSSAPPPAGDGPDPVIAPDKLDAVSIVFSGSAIDASTGELIPDTTFRFFEGESLSNRIVDLSGTEVSEIVSSDGTYDVTLKENSSPDVITVAVSADGFLDNSVLVPFTDEQTDIFVEVLLASAATVDAVVRATKDATVESGAIGAELVVETQRETNRNDASAVSSKVTLPRGTRLIVSDGQPISGNKISVSVTDIDVSNPATTNIIPDGLNDVVEGEAVNALKGAAQLTVLDDQGNQVTRFASPITINIGIPDDGSFIAGDPVNISTYSAVTNTWTRNEFMAPAGALDSSTNTYPITFETDHLSWFIPGISLKQCSTRTIVVNVSGDDPTGRGVRLSMGELGVFRLRGPGTQTFTSNVAYPVSTSVLLRSSSVFDSENSWAPGLFQSFVPCTDSAPGGLNLTLTDPNPPETTTFVDDVITLAASCFEDTTIAVPTTGAVVKFRAGARGAYDRTAIDNGDGSYSTTQLIEGKTYTFKATARFRRSIEGDSARFEIFEATGRFVADTDISNTTVSFTPNCSPATGAAS